MDERDAAAECVMTDACSCVPGCVDVWAVGQGGLCVTKAVHEGRHHQRVANP